MKQFLLAAAWLTTGAIVGICLYLWLPAALAELGADAYSTMARAPLRVLGVWIALAALSGLVARKARTSRKLSLLFFMTGLAMYPVLLAFDAACRVQSC
ncbi:hypothetical protein [Mycobacterium talmoniae]|uniref:Uncharacterized protein n=1 Tax=Mycobacterium talmoniae TaxID=1858794 RepID=A0A1S1NDL6_9MYCO|nr:MULTISPECIES: hypothetical protein [Mycobacterium]OHU96445.1 hypothetical protein BKN37_22645 [Mycobacterium talmoniae]PQM46268.1 hypothetical protein C1Y40_03566 [Mycobacterium talmoniae]TDH47904.1 hypothetical protein E2F47_26020 [Mycobacterium eburneum]